MDIVQNLNYTFEEQCFLQAEKLREELRASDSKKKLSRQRIYRQNIFEYITPTQKQYLDTILTHILKCTGKQLNKNLESPRHASPFLVVSRSNAKNYIYDEDGVIHLKSRKHVAFKAYTLKKQAFMLHIIAKVLKLIESDTYMTKRECFYQSLEFCRVKSKKLPLQSQSQSQTQNQTQTQTQSQGSQVRRAQETIKYSGKGLDEVLNDLCCLVGCSKIHLRILTQPKGTLYGELSFELMTGETVDCFSSQQGVIIPARAQITGVKSDAKFILVLEKDSVLQKMICLEKKWNFVKRYKVILLTGRGYPDISTRAFLNFLWSRLKIPILALTDADPHGIDIVCTYKFGCYTSAHEGSHLAVPQIRWLGLLPLDVSRHSLPQSAMLPLTKSDEDRIDSLLKRPYLKGKKAWIEQLHLIRDSQKKAELESLDATGEFLVKTFLPNKLRYASWL